MAAPFVSALVGYLLAYDPNLSVAQPAHRQVRVRRGRLRQPHPPDDLALPDCTSPAAPTADFTVATADPAEGQVVKVVDRSSDPRAGRSLSPFRMADRFLCG